MTQTLAKPRQSISCLASLLDYLDQLNGPAVLDKLRANVQALNLRFEDLEAHARFSTRCYTRNLVQGGEWYHALVLCWRNGQRSPIHDHRGSNCVVRVLKGTMTETLFDHGPNGLVRAQGSSEYAMGSVIASYDTDMHQVSNLQADGADLVTLHVYSPPLLNMGTYSLMDGTRGIEPMFLDFGEMDGI